MKDKAYQWKVYPIPPKETDIERHEKIFAYHRGTDVTGLKVEKAREYAQRDGMRYAVIMVDYYGTEKPIIVLESAMDEPEIAEFITSIVAIINEDGSIA
jgi:hypothetical protein